MEPPIKYVTLHAEGEKFFIIMLGCEDYVDLLGPSYVSLCYGYDGSPAE